MKKTLFAQHYIRHDFTVSQTETAVQQCKVPQHILTLHTVHTEKI